MMKTVQLRPFRAEDLKFILELEANRDIGPFIRPWPAEEHIGAQSSPNLTYLIACHDDVEIGFVILRTHDDRSAEVEFVRLAIGTRGIGLGKATVEAVKQHARHRMAANVIWLEVFPENPRARGLYSALDFKPIDVRETDLGFGGNPGQVIRMEHELID